MNETRNVKLREDAFAIWLAGVRACSGDKVTREAVNVTEQGISFVDFATDFDSFDRIVVLGAGKSSGFMARGLSKAISAAGLEKPITGWINVPETHVCEVGSIEVFPARPVGVNLPTKRVIDGTTRILEIANNTTDRDLCICLISGGGSALLELPLEGLDLDSICQTTSFLSSSGASIEELNVVRKKLSAVKGGGLARSIRSDKVVSLILSDILGDPIDLIASGPTAADFSTVGDAVDILEKYDSDRKAVPAAVWEKLSSTIDLDAPERFKTSAQNIVIGNNQTATKAARKKARELGYEISNTKIRKRSSVSQSSKEFADEIAKPSSVKKSCIVSGGEPTISLPKPTGKGGRNQHLVLSTLLRLLEKESKLKHQSGFCLLSAGTDGEDGNVDAAGGVVSEQTLNFIREHDLIEDAMEHSANFDSNPFLKKIDALVCSRTETNVCDLRVLLKEGSENFT